MTKSKTEMMKLIDDYPRVGLGLSKDNEIIILKPPSWDCNWYWGFGYIGNMNLGTHLDSIGDNNHNLYTNIKNYFRHFIINDEHDIYVFCELVKSIYHLREQAEFYARGGMHYTNNPCKELLQNSEMWSHINMNLIPKLINELYKLLEKYHETD